MILFLYPIHGASQVWEEMYKKCIALGGKFSLESEVCQLFYDGKKIKAVEYKKNDNIRCEVADIVVSTIPLKELIEKIDSIPENIRKIGRSIKYRDMVTVSFTILKKYGGEKLIKNIKDNWIYLQEKSVRAGRLQILNNWSEASTNNEKFFLLQVEYYCDEDDEYWKLSDTRWAIMALEEMKKCSIISSEAAIEEYKVNRVSKAYPVYDENYKEIKKIWKTIDLINNIYCIGRNGRHIYGNMDQVMGSAVFASQVICAEGNGKDRLWYINQTDGYIEEK